MASITAASGARGRDLATRGRAAPAVRLCHPPPGSAVPHPVAPLPGSAVPSPVRAPRRASTHRRTAGSGPLSATGARRGAPSPSTDPEPIRGEGSPTRNPPRNSTGPEAVIPGRSEAEGTGIHRVFRDLRDEWVPFLHASRSPGTTVEFRAAKSENGRLRNAQRSPRGEKAKAHPCGKRTERPHRAGAREARLRETPRLGRAERSRRSETPSRGRARPLRVDHPRRRQRRRSLS